MICTYFHDWELNNMIHVEDKDLNELYQELRQRFNNRYYLKERIIVNKKLFRKPGSRTLYTLYADIDGKGQTREVMIINFAQEHEWSINTTVPKSYITTYFLGLLAGQEYRNSLPF